MYFYVLLKYTFIRPDDVLVYQSYAAGIMFKLFTSYYRSINVY